MTYPATTRARRLMEMAYREDVDPAAELLEDRETPERGETPGHLSAGALAIPDLQNPWAAITGAMADQLEAGVARVAAELVAALEPLPLVRFAAAAADAAGLAVVPIEYVPPGARWELGHLHVSNPAAAAIDVTVFLDSGGAGGWRRVDASVAEDTPAQPGEQNAAVVADGVATDAVGVKLSYSPPAGQTARVTAASWFNNVGAPTVQLELVRGGAVIVLRQDVASYRDDTDVVLLDGDVLRLNVTVAGAVGANADAAIFAVETTPGEPAEVDTGVSFYWPAMFLGEGHRIEVRASGLTAGAVLEVGLFGRIHSAR